MEGNISKVVGIIGSPREKGNTDIILSKILEGVKEEKIENEKIYLKDYKILPCRICLKCKNTGKCVVSDDFNKIFSKINNAKGIVIGSPIYCKTVTSYIKLLLEKIESSQLVRENNKLRYRMKGKRFGVVVCVCDLDEMETLYQGVKVMERFLKDIRAINLYNIVKNNLNYKGDVLKYPHIIELAIKVGKELGRKIKNCM
jgi:multimeric flavodoxin WrbA